MRLALAAASTLALSTLAGCSADSASDEDGIELGAQEQATRTSCTNAEYAAALVTYKDTVALAKKHLRGEMCDEATTHDILAGASKAVSTCGGFESVYANSPWAKPVRDVLAKNVGLAEITGKLRPTERGRATWRGLTDALPGKTIYGPAPGAFGNVTKLELGENGKAVLRSLDTEAYAWSAKDVTYEVGAIRADGTITFTLVDGATRTVYTLGHADFGNGQKLPIFELKPVDGGASSFTVPSECEA